ncbi:hypothetical protein Egran_04601 [Elaphomyces granulatus]|uniref:Uncharacterized protein n=1 Tax=Elaphomyces granulatus TaxID=519963 RepID=A0A232LU73_9EURO|nr:hypothetical protein Egran_04601 [Elaphomyces granulatus]
MAASYNCAWRSSSMKPEAVPCGPLNSTTPVLSCCVPGDICLSHNLCGYTHSLPNGTGYYTAGCSDGDFSNGAIISGTCSKRCSDAMLPDIAYDSNRGVWRCCAYPNGTRDCLENPTDETFSAAAPSDLIAYWTAGATTSMATTSQTQSAELRSSSIGSTITNSNISSAPISTDSGGSSLSTRAVAGIVVSSIIAGIALISVIVVSMRNRYLSQRFEEKDDIVSSNTSRNREDQQHRELQCYPPELPEQPRNPSISA